VPVHPAARAVPIASAAKLAARAVFAPLVFGAAT
jgi:hypothetical protein